MTTRPVDSTAAQSPGPNPNPLESGGEREEQDVHNAPDNEVEPDDPDVAGDDLSQDPQ